MSADSIANNHDAAAGIGQRATPAPGCMSAPADHEHMGRPAASGRTHRRPHTNGRRRSPILLVLLALPLFAALFVGWDVAVHYLMPDMPTGVRHALLTLGAGLVTLMIAWMVYASMHRQQQRLSATAERLARLLESYQGSVQANRHFENPHRVHCREILDCTNAACPMYNDTSEPCWQVVALANHHDTTVPQVQIQQCRECQVYRTACPDALTELGESFNSLMFLLDEERERTGRMRAQMAERQKMVAIGQMAAGIAHEINNPLSSISSITQMLKRTGSDQPEPEQLDLIDAHVQRISCIVRQLSTLARPGAEDWTLVNVGQTLEQAVRLISFDRRARNINIDFTPPQPPLPRSYALRNELQQVFINLAMNAMDAMGDGGTLTIRAETQRRRIVVHIRDTGSGIDRGIGRRVFDPFFTTKEPGEGTGMGLAVSYNIVQKHGGNIDFESTPGEGTEFVVSIPVLESPPDNGSAPSSPGG